MNTVQEIEAALASLPRAELDAVEKRIAELKRCPGENSQANYAQKDYGVTCEEMERFEDRMLKHNQHALETGATTLFQGPFDPAFLD